MNKFGQTIKDARQAAGLTQESLTEQGLPVPRPAFIPKFRAKVPSGNALQESHEHVPCSDLVGICFLNCVFKIN